jgi:hypothetical protein
MLNIKICIIIEKILMSKSLPLKLLATVEKDYKKSIST